MAEVDKRVDWANWIFEYAEALVKQQKLKEFFNISEENKIWEGSIKSSKSYENIINEINTTINAVCKEFKGDEYDKFINEACLHASYALILLEGKSFKDSRDESGVGIYEPSDIYYTYRDRKYK